MKRILLTLLSGMLALTLLSGCHGRRGQKAFVLPETLDESRTYELTFWAKNDTNKTQTAIYERAIAEFESLYPNIRINLRLYTDYSRIYNDVITNIATGTTPNICITYPDHIATYLSGENVVVPLDGLIADEKYGLGGSEIRYDAPRPDEVIPKFLDECRLGGTLYALPFMRSTEVCYVNKTYVEALGYTLPETLTWDFVWEVAEAATEKNSDGTYRLNGQKVMIPFLYKSTDNMMIQMLRQKGAGYSDEDGTIRIFNDTTRALLTEIAAHAASGAFSTFKISSYPANFLNAGQCLFAIDSTAGATWMGSHAPLSDISEEAFVEFETEVMMLPQFDPEHPQMISQGPSVCLFNKPDADEVLASWLFMQYLLSDGIQTAYAETEGYVPVTSKAQNSEEYRAYLAAAGTDDNLHYAVKIQASRMLLEHTDDTFVTPVFNGSASLRNAAGDLIENVTKSVRRSQTVDGAYLDRLESDMRSLYRLSGRSASTSGRQELGPLPTASVVLLSVLGAVWTLMIAYAIVSAVRKMKHPS